jgi:hypothetical protein
LATDLEDRYTPMRALPIFRVLLPWAAVIATVPALAQTEVPSTPPRYGMTFELVDTAGLCDDCMVVQAQGRIDEETSSDFWRFLARNRLKKVVIVVLHSSGGLMKDASAVGSALRSLDARTVVGRAVRKGKAVEIAPGSCLSACPMIFVGGTRRAVPDRSQLGVHRWMPKDLVDRSEESDDKPPALDRDAVQSQHAATARYMEHLDRMGIDLRLIMRALQTPYESMRRLNRQELRELKVVTDDPLTATEPGRPRPVLVLPAPQRTTPQAKRGATG